MKQNRNLQLLSAADVAFFEAHGYLHVKSVVLDQQLDRMQKSIEHWVDKAIYKWKKKGLIQSDFKELPFDERLYRAWVAANRPAYKEVLMQEIASKEMFNFLMLPNFINIIRDLLGGDNIQALAGFMCRPKLPNKVFDMNTPWHQDAQCTMYHGTTDVNFMTIWVPFMDVDTSNSCLQVSEDSHIDPIVFDDAKNGTIHYSIHPEHSNKFVKLRALPIKRGDVLCLHQRVAHRALPNMTDRMRWSMDIRYESLADPTPPAIKRGFICAHQNPALVVKNHEEAFAGLWEVLNH